VATRAIGRTKGLPAPRRSEPVAKCSNYSLPLPVRGSVASLTHISHLADRRRSTFRTANDPVRRAPQEVNFHLPLTATAGRIGFSARPRRGAGALSRITLSRCGRCGTDSRLRACLFQGGCSVRAGCIGSAAYPWNFCRARLDAAIEMCGALRARRRIRPRDAVPVPADRPARDAIRRGTPRCAPPRFHDRSPDRRNRRRLAGSSA